MKKEENLIRGPIFGWPFPILNAILRFIDLLRERRMERFGSKRSTPSSPATYSNIEEYEIFEDKQGVIKVRVHRKARRRG